MSWQVCLHEGGVNMTTTTTEAAWIGWLKLAGRHQRWKAVASGASWGAAWDALLGFPIGGDKVVLKAGVPPEAKQNASRRTRH